MSEDGYQKYMMKEFEKMGIYVQDVSVDFHGKDNSRDYSFTIDMPFSIVEDEIIEFAKYEGSIKSL